MAATDLLTSSQPGGADILPACDDEGCATRTAGVLVPASARCESECVSRSEEAGLAVASGADRSRQINVSLSPVASSARTTAVTHSPCRARWPRCVDQARPGAPPQILVVGACWSQRSASRRGVVMPLSPLMSSSDVGLCPAGVEYSASGPLPRRVIAPAGRTKALLPRRAASCPGLGFHLGPVPVDHVHYGTHDQVLVPGPHGHVAGGRGPGRGLRRRRRSSPIRPICSIRAAQWRALAAPEARWVTSEPRVLRWPAIRSSPRSSSSSPCRQRRLRRARGAVSSPTWSARRPRPLLSPSRL
jgi:hypothetical protein